MRESMKYARLRVAAGLFLGALSAASFAQGQTSRTYHFDVFLDEDRVGQHRFEVTREGDRKTVLSEADFAVKVLFITAFSYEHRNREVWSGRCLAAIESRTDSNGERFQVDGSAGPGSFEVRTANGEEKLPSCVRTFAYWDRSLLDQPRLLNSQTGEHLAVDLAGPESSQIDLAGGASVSAERYALSGNALDITLYYGPGSDDWLALDSRLENGRTLRYRLRDTSGLMSAPATQPIDGTTVGIK